MKENLIKWYQALIRQDMMSHDQIIKELAYMYGQTEEFIREVLNPPPPDTHQSYSCSSVFDDNENTHH